MKKVTLISKSACGHKAEIVVKLKGSTTTRHVHIENDGLFHWRDPLPESDLHETYDL